MPESTFTTEQILRIIKEQQEDALLDQQRLWSLFADYSRGQMKAQKNQLRIFLDCQGNTCILNLCSESKQTQQVRFTRLVRQMRDDYSMQESVALEMCSTFWRVVHDTPVPDYSLQSATLPQPSDTAPLAEPKGESKIELKSSIKKERIPSAETPEFDISPEGNLHKYNGTANHVIVPAGVKEIGFWAFSSNKNLQSVVLPDGVTTIWGHAFSYCEKLTSITLPGTIEHISGNAFFSCTDLQEVMLPGSMQTVNLHIFTACFKLRKITLSSGVRRLVIEDAGNILVERLEIPDTLTWIERDVRKDRNAIRQYYRTTIVASQNWINAHQQFFRENPDFVYEVRKQPSLFARAKKLLTK